MSEAVVVAAVSTAVKRACLSAFQCRS